MHPLKSPVGWRWRLAAALLVATSLLGRAAVSHAVAASACGKYRAVVLNNLDPLQAGRLQLEVPDVYGVTTSPWALPSVPPGPVHVPNVGDVVWAEFEACNPDLPVWGGTYQVHCSGVTRSGKLRGCKTGPP